MDRMEKNEVLQKGERIKPLITLKDVPQLLHNYYAFPTTINKVSECNGYDDKNFYVESENGQKYIFKVLNSLDSKNSEHVLAEHSVMRFLSSKGVNCPYPIKTVHGTDYEIVSNPITGQNIIRLLAYVEGTVLHEVKTTPTLLTNVGEYISHINFTLKELSLPTSLENHSSIWMLSHVPDLLKFIYVVKDDPKKYETVSSVLQKFEEKVIPCYPNLQKGILHGDVNGLNVLVGPNKKISKKIQEVVVVGLIDFGDMQISYYVWELAVTMCYMMLQCLESKEIDPVVGSAHVLQGYRKYMNVSNQEISLLRTLIASRLCQSLVLGAYTYSLDPGNEYLLSTAKTGWELLFRIWNETTEHELQRIWRK